MIWLKDNGKFSEPMISCKMMTKILYGNLNKVFLSAKNGFKKDLPALPPHEFVHVYIINK